MILYSTDIALLSKMKKAQVSLDGYTLVTNTDVRFCTGFSTEDVNRAIGNPQHLTKHNLSSAELYASLDRMVALGLVKKFGNSPTRQVTYDGWNARQVRNREIIKMIVTHIVFPSAVAFFTTLFTLWVQGIL